jgi:hypothetical protein
MADDKARVHFGWFVNRRRMEHQPKALTLKELGAKIGVGEKRMWDIEQMPVPDISEGTRSGLARFCGMTPEAFDRAWMTTKVPPPKKRKAGIRAEVMRIIPVPAESYKQLEVIAKAAEGQSVPEYIIEHARLESDRIRREINTTKGRISPLRKRSKPRPSRATGTPA